MGVAVQTSGTVGQTVGHSVPVDRDSRRVIPLVPLRISMARVPVTGTELPCGGTSKINDLTYAHLFKQLLGKRRGNKCASCFEFLACHKKNLQIIVSLDSFQISLAAGNCFKL